MDDKNKELDLVRSAFEALTRTYFREQALGANIKSVSLSWVSLLQSNAATHENHHVVFPNITIEFALP